MYNPYTFKNLHKHFFEYRKLPKISSTSDALLIEDG